VADVNGNEGTGETEEPSGNDVTNIQGAEVVVPTFSLQGHTGGRMHHGASLLCSRRAFTDMKEASTKVLALRH
jgi:hypothetical protein